MVNIRFPKKERFYIIHTIIMRTVDIIKAFNHVPYSTPMPDLKDCIMVAVWASVPFTQHTPWGMHRQYECTLECTL